MTITSHTYFPNSVIISGRIHVRTHNHSTSARTVSRSTACEQICMYPNNNICYIFYIQYDLHKASGAGQTAVVTLLLDHGADVHAVNESIERVG